ncbi:UPF0481-like protein [Cinnamomum micranthum f. kanehirae]|uniref:UPF0481-like protein n=1 Tax=Cinnamomum micranthum f. kanehirae TaxID=337451 RepID=A0A3S3NRH6_9MAGN|nr:UPF0481-like protein [Cinnamomum micranthum f. kanehirae]
MEEINGEGRADTVAVDIQALEDGVIQQNPIPLDDGDEAYTAEITCVPDVVAVDMEHFLVPSRACQDDGEEAHVREVTRVLEMVAVEMERLMSDDDDEEANIPFRREDLNSIWVSSIKQKNHAEPKILKASSASKSCSIHRVPCWLPKDNLNAYRPQLISIGPYHYKKRKSQLRAMEEHKRRYLQGICFRKPEGWLEDCLTTIKRLEKRARNYYSEVIPLDNGCFLIELFRKSRTEKDVIFKLNWPRKTIYFDLILMENQIPFFILQHLSQKIDASERCLPLTDDRRSIRGPIGLIFCQQVPDSLIYILNGHTQFLNNLKYPREWVRIPCASRLKERGIKFKRRDIAGDAEVFNIMFDFDKGVIEIPTIQVWDQTKIEFLNFIAFEQCYPHCHKYITAYCYFMDCLINTAQDVEILSSKGIIEDALGSEELVASHFNSMARGTINYTEDFYLSDVCNDINRYSKRCWPKLRASLVHDYFNNPWAIISFLAALFLLLLTMTQTFFTSFPKFAYGK